MSKMIMLIVGCIEIVIGLLFFALFKLPIIGALFAVTGILFIVAFVLTKSDNVDKADSEGVLCILLKRSYIRFRAGLTEWI